MGHAEVVWVMKGWDGVGHVGMGWDGSCRDGLVGSCRGGVGDAAVGWGGSCRVELNGFFLQLTFNLLQMTQTPEIITHRVLKNF